MKQRYSETLDEKLQVVKDALAFARRPGANEEDLGIAIGVVHRLRGSASTFGYVELAGSLAEAERLLKALRRGQLEREHCWSLVDAALVRFNEPPQPPTAPVSRNISDVAAQIGRVRILVVDDDPDVLREIELFGRSASMCVVGATSLERAQALATASQFDLAMVDLHLSPPDTPDAVVRTLRARAATEKLPVVAFSVDDSVENQLRAVEAGSSLFLTKPLALDALALSIQHVLDANQPQHRRLLLIDADFSFVSLLVAASKDLWSVLHQSNPASLLASLETETPDIVVLGDCTPLSTSELCGVLRANPRWRQLPIVVRAPLKAPHAAFYRAGADNVLTTETPIEEVLAIVRQLLDRAHQFSRLAHYDPLTGLLTRSAFQDALERGLAEAARRSRELSVVVLDIDHFKQVNDTYGHATGDRVLRGLGQVLRAVLRTEDLPGRWGGEEFVIILHETSLESAQIVVERLLAKFSAEAFEAPSGKKFTCTFSAGIASFPADDDSAQDLLRRADARLYDAKALGRNRVSLRG